MIIALLTVLFMGGGAENAVLEFWNARAKNVGEVIQVEDRQASVGETIDAIEASANAMDDSRRTVVRSMAPYFEEFDGDTTGIDALLDGFLETTNKYNADMVDLRFRLKDQLSREEWDALFAN